jgi:hypothetical protein
MLLNGIPSSFLGGSYSELRMEMKDARNARYFAPGVSLLRMEPCGPLHRRDLKDWVMGCLVLKSLEG